MWQNILPHVSEWMKNNEIFLDEKVWKMLFVEEVWTSKVNEQGFKGLSIHFKFIIPQWATISFPFFNCNK